MKNYFIRAGQSPFDSLSYGEVIRRNTLGGNSGNLLYAQSVFRTLMTDEKMKMMPNFYHYRPFSPRVISEKFDAFVVPLADAFRADFAEMDLLTEFIEKLTIPTIIIGVGLRAPFDYTPGMKFSFDKQVARLVRAVLKNSSMIGVRGAITAEYLSGLGFKEGEDHRVIGCPSMYTFGRELNIKDPISSYDNTVCVNATATSNLTITNDFIFREAKKFNDYYFLPQLNNEYQLAYAGISYTHKKCGYYPDSLDSAEYSEDRVRIFKNAHAWSEFTKNMDFAFGGRLHGNIGALLGGTPGLLFTKDARTRELADFHKLPSLPETEIDENASILDLIEKADYSTYKRVHPANFDNYIDFLEINGLEHIYQDKFNHEKAPFDKVIDEKYQEDQELLAIACNGAILPDRMERVVETSMTSAKNKALVAQKALSKQNILSEKEQLVAKKVVELQQAVNEDAASFKKIKHDLQKAHGVQDSEQKQIVELGKLARRQLNNKKKILSEYSKVTDPLRKIYRVMNIVPLIKSAVQTYRYGKMHS